MTVTGKLHSLETMGLVDGPGIRTVFFLQGCPLRCAYCHNPDSQAIGCGRDITVEDVVNTAKRYRVYYGDKGGVTFSGGEPLLQGEFVYRAMRALKEEGIDICLDTSGYGDRRYHAKVLPLVDHLLLDVKHFRDPEFQQLTGAPFKTYRDFLKQLKRNGFKGRIYIRHVMVPGRTDNEQSMRDLVNTILPLADRIERIEILPYHTMGTEKYRELNMPYKLEGIPPMDPEAAKRYEDFANALLAERAGKGGSKRTA